MSLTRRHLFSLLAAAPVAAKAVEPSNMVSFVERIDLNAPGCPVALMTPATGVSIRLISHWDRGESRLITRFDPARLPA